MVHIPTIGHLSDLFTITYLCDVSNDALVHCQGRIAGKQPSVTRNAEDLCCSPNVDVVLVANSDAFHVPHTLLGLKYNKTVLVEKPMALNLRDADLIIEAEKASSGQVMVGYMRRYAAAFQDAVKELGGRTILYARVRDIIGPNAAFVTQSGTFPKVFSDFSAEDSNELKARTDGFLEQALVQELGLPVTPSNTLMWRLLGGLGSHDLSAMREVLGMPEEVRGAVNCGSTENLFWR